MQQCSTGAQGERGISLVGFIFIIAILAAVAILGMKVVPTVIEYAAVKKAIVNAKLAGSTPLEVKTSFDKQRDATYIDSVSAQDLQITRGDDGLDVSIEYHKKIALFGPVSLLIDYAATTASGKPGSGRKIE
jgi:hypothetical protein